MACFLVTAAEAAVVTVAAKAIASNEKKQAEALHLTTEKYTSLLASQGKLTLSRKLKWLSWLLWGGALLLCFEHIWHGEVVPWFPFLTAAANPVDMAAMLHEMSTVGVTMAVIVTAVWAMMVGVAAAILKRPHSSSTLAE